MEKYDMWLFRTQVNAARRTLERPEVTRYELLENAGHIGRMLGFALDADKAVARQLYTRDVLLTKVSNLATE